MTGITPARAVTPRLRPHAGAHRPAALADREPGAKSAAKRAGTLGSALPIGNALLIIFRPLRPFSAELLCYKPTRPGQHGVIQAPLGTALGGDVTGLPLAVGREAEGRGKP